MPTQYYLLDKTHRDYEDILAKLESRTKVMFGDNHFSIAENKDGTKAYAKVPYNGDRLKEVTPEVYEKVQDDTVSWKTDNGLDSIGGCILAIHDKKGQEKFLADHWYKDSEWENQFSDLAQEFIDSEKNK